MNISFLTSGFPNDFIKCIKDCYNNNNGSFTFIALDFEQYSKTDRYIDKANCTLINIERMKNNDSIDYTYCFSNKRL